MARPQARAQGPDHKRERGVGANHTREPMVPEHKRERTGPDHKRERRGPDHGRKQIGPDHKRLRL